MSQKTLSSKLVKVGVLPLLTSNASDTISTICDMGDCQNATAIVDLSYSSHSVTDLAFWTSNVVGDMVATPIVATTAIIAVEIASDDDSFQAWNGNTRITDAAIASNQITSLAASGVYAIELPNIRRYLCAQFNEAGTGSTMGITFIGRDPSGSDRPWTAARTGY